MNYHVSVNIPGFITLVIETTLDWQCGAKELPIKIANFAQELS